MFSSNTIRIKNHIRRGYPIPTPSTPSRFLFSIPALNSLYFMEFSIRYLVEGSVFILSVPKVRRELALYFPPHCSLSPSQLHVHWFLKTDEQNLFAKKSNPWYQRLFQASNKLEHLPKVSSSKVTTL